MPGLFSSKLSVTELNTTALALAALLGLSLACLAYYKCAKPVLDEQDFKLKKAREASRKARPKMN